MAAEKILFLELSNQPKVHLIYNDDWTCKKCKGCISLLVENDWNCVTCLIEKSQFGKITMFGWQLSRAGVGQINANRIS